MPRMHRMPTGPAFPARRALAGVFTAAALATLGGCVTGAPPASAPAARSAAPAGDGALTSLQRAEQLYENGRLTEALIACSELSRKDRYMDGLPELEERILSRIAYERDRQAALRSDVSRRIMAADVAEDRNTPDTYGVSRVVDGERGSLRTPASPMEQALQKKVTVHLDGVTLTDFILAIGATENVNIIADAEESSGTMSIHAEDVPLREILDYVSRNLGVKFYVGENIIWATPAPDNEETQPMETRMYRLRKGLANKDLEDPQSADANSVVTTIKRFVPDVDGSDFLYDPKSHVIIVRNTRENLAQVERIIDVLDVAPPQVLIEARFISTSITDLRELGIDWMLNSPLVVSTRPVVVNGVRDSSAPRTQVTDASLSAAGFANAQQGLNFTYQGLLTDPMFQAVLHALQTSGKARTLSAPKVTTISNRPATIRIGQDFRYFEEYDVETVASESGDNRTVYTTTLVPVGKPTLEELGIQLDVTPSVGADLSAITLQLKPEISEFVDWIYYQTSQNQNQNQNQNNPSNAIDNTATNVSGLATIKLPIFRRSEIDTEVVVRSGETVVMGGLISSSETKKKSGIPLLSSLPLFGKLFTHENVEDTQQNLLIFVTATLISDRGESLVPMGEIALRRRN